MLKTGSVLEFWPRIGLDKSFQGWILTKVHKRLSRKNSTNLCVMKWLVKSLKQVKIKNPFGIHFFKPTPNTLRMGCIFIYF